MLSVYSNQIRFAIVFSGFYIFLVFVLRHKASNDPSSVFFDKKTAYDLRYSEIRQSQSNAYIEALHINQTKANDHGRPDFCIGVTTFARPNHRYFKSTVGSLLEGLDPSERTRFHLILFLAHTDPTIHPAYSEEWMPLVADTLLTYDGLDENDFSYLRQLEQTGGNYYEKTTFDYLYLMQKCEETKAPYMLLVEDDVLFLDGWFHRTREALRVAQQKALAKGYETFYYLRLFYTERFFGWNREDWSSYLFHSLLTTCIIGGITLGIRRLYLAQTIPKPSSRVLGVSNALVAQILLYSALTILLVFAAGRNTVFPLRSGVQEMAQYGCCSQGMVFPSGIRAKVGSYLDLKKTLPLDSNLEDYADAHHELRLALAPSVMQHVGSASSRDNRANAYKIFNFAFEGNDAEALRKDHLRALE